MTISRRKFLRAGTVAALAAGIPLNSALSAFGQGNRKERDANPVEGLAVDSLSYYTKSAFASYLHSTFLLKAGTAVTIALTLDEIKDIGSGTGPAGRESFSLGFNNGDGTALPQGTYGIEHAALGSFALMLVPGGFDKSGGQSYVAIINRLGNSPALFSTAGNASSSLTVKPDGEVTPKQRPAPVTPGVAPKKAQRVGKSGDLDGLRESVLIDQ
jgi:hypothetical protein